MNTPSEHDLCENLKPINFGDYSPYVLPSRGSRHASDSGESDGLSRVFIGVFASQHPLICELSDEGRYSRSVSEDDCRDRSSE